MKQKTYFTELESIRGIAALMVCIFHVRNWFALKSIPFISNFDLFVDFFFVLSGFVIALNFSSTITDGTSYKNYLIKRVFRLYPLFLAASIPYFITSILKTYYGSHAFETSNYFKLNEFIAYITLTSKWGLVRDLIYNHPSWSISVEFFLYIIAGLIFMISKNRTVNIILSVSLSSISLALLLVYGGVLNTTGNLSVLRGTFSFFIGVLVYNLFSAQNPIFTKTTPFAQNICLLATVGLITVAFIFANKSSAVKFAFPFIWAGIIYLIINKNYPTWLFRFLNFKYIEYLGTISYSFYLLHPLMIFVTEKILKKSHLENSATSSIGGIFLYICLTFIAAGFTFTYIELPGKALYQRFKPASKKLGSIAYN